MSDNKYSDIYLLMEELAKQDKSLEKGFQDPTAETEDHPEHYYNDAMIPKLGNKFAYSKFIPFNRNKGVHLGLDVNGMGEINTQHGIETGNGAIKELFELISDLALDYGLQAFRTGGDKGRLFSSNSEKANEFATNLQAKLEGMAPVKGTSHKMSVSVGIGYTPEHADRALSAAKDVIGTIVNGKRVKKFKPGAEPVIIHSLLSESPPADWKPAVERESYGRKEDAIPGGLKLNNPLKIK
jgi:GGDEF domain-containing protein